MNYRPDIDGLRAVAVLLVVGFHAWPPLVPGGFVGVDVFFVISGYLVTGLMLRHEGTVSEFIKKFYERRIRRLAPPIIPVLLFSGAMAYAVLPPEALEEFAYSVIAFLTFWSNWFFLGGSGYFDGASETQPLLHTWSLSIEEQFYLLFPIPVLLIRRLSRDFVPIFFLTVFITTFLFNVMLIGSGDTDAAYFSSLGRFWEISVGALLACGVIPEIRKRWQQSTLGLIGLALIVIAGWFYTDETPFPGVAGLAPTLGAACIIIGKGGVAGRMLAWKPLVGIGLISYAVYLWHWPLLAFLRVMAPEAGFFLLVACVIASFALATASFILVERPIRARVVLPRARHAYGLLGVVVSVFVSASAAAMATRGLAYRYPQSAETYRLTRETMLAEWRELARVDDCLVNHLADMDEVRERCVISEQNTENVLVLGDSHAGHVIPGLEQEFPDTNFVLLAVSSCSLVWPAPETRPACVDLTRWLDNFSDDRFDAIIISTREVHYDGVDALADRAVQLSAYAPVTVLGPIQFYRPNMPTIYADAVGRERPEVIAEAFDAAVTNERFLTNSRLAERLAGEPSVNFISLLDVMCPDRRCRHYDADGWPILIDNTHMSPETSRWLIRRISSQLEL